MNLVSILVSAIIMAASININSIDPNVPTYVDGPMKSNISTDSNVPTYYVGPIESDISTYDILPIESGIPDFYVPPNYYSVNIAIPTSVEIINETPNYLDVKLSKDLQRHIYREYFRLECDKYLNKEEFLSLIVSMIRWESGFDASNSNGKCHGLMSIMTLPESTMEAWSIEDLLDPYDNITAGIHCFLNGCNWALENYEKDLMIEHALLRYNLGENDAENYLKTHSIYEYKYAQNIIGSMNQYLQELNNA